MIGKGAAIPEFIDRITEAADGPARRDLDVLLERLRQDHPTPTADRQRRHGVLRRGAAPGAASTSTPSRCAPTSTSPRCAPACST